MLHVVENATRCVVRAGELINHYASVAHTLLVFPKCQVRDLEDAVQELWKRRDIFDRDLIANLRAAAGLPTQEEIFSISPFSDDEDSSPIAPKSEYGRSVKFSLKRLVDKSPTCPVEQEFIIYSNQYFCE